MATSEKNIDRVILGSDLTLAEQASPPAAPAAGFGRIYRKTDGKVYSMGPDGIEKAVGSGGSIDQITQVAHGFVDADIGRPLYLNGSTYAFAKADLADTAEVAGLFSRRIDDDTFEMTLSGEVLALTTNAFQEGALPAMGTLVWLSATTAGKLTVTKPSTTGHIGKPQGKVSRSGGGTCDLYFENMRAEVIGAAQAETAISLANNATTNVVDVSSRDSGTIEGYVEVNAGTPMRIQFRMPFVRRGDGTFEATLEQTGTNSPGTLVMSNAGVLQVTLSNHAGFVSARAVFRLNMSNTGPNNPLPIGESSVVPDGGAPGQFETITASKAIAFSSPHMSYVNTPSAAVLIDLPSGTEVKKGYPYRVEVNAATEANYVALRATSAGTPSGEIDRIGGSGFIQVVALQDNPTQVAHWRISDVEEKAFPAIGTVTFSGSAPTGTPTSRFVCHRRKNLISLFAYQAYPNGAPGTVTSISVATGLPSRFQHSFPQYSHGIGGVSAAAGVVFKNGTSLPLVSVATMEMYNLNEPSIRNWQMEFTYIKGPTT